MNNNRVEIECDGLIYKDPIYPEGDKYLIGKNVNNISTLALIQGVICKKPCEICGTDIRITKHHEDYSKPLEIRWLCQKHHLFIHGAIKKMKTKLKYNLDLIDWEKLSLFLTHYKDVVTNDKVPKQYNECINELIELIENWKNKITESRGNII